jgi:hypothetical protein
MESAFLPNSIEGHHHIVINLKRFQFSRVHCKQR